MNKEISQSFIGTRRDQNISNISMIVTLISFTMLFATLFLGYALYRLTSDVWPPMGIDRVSLGLPSLSTAIIFLSSITYWVYEKKFLNGNRKDMWLLATSILGVLFLCTQFFFWESLKSTGLYAGSGIFGSIIYGFTWIHAAHIFLGLGALGWLLVRLKQDKAINMTVQNVGKFWHFLGIVWLIMFIVIFAI